MLDIPLLKDRQSRKKTDGKEFLQAALEIVNLALFGFINSETIQALLNIYGYPEPQDVNSRTNLTIHAVRMDTRRLRKYLRQQKSRDGSECHLRIRPH